MKIQKRKYAVPSQSTPIFAIPTFTYFFNKVSGFVNPDLEWVWWVSISVSVAIWFFINFKIKINGNN